MKLWFKQRLFSWFDSYDIYYEDGSVAYTVKGQFSWGHCLHILDASGGHIATLWEDVSSLLARFEVYVGEEYVGNIQREATFLRPHYDIDYNGWQVDGDLFAWDYTVKSQEGTVIASISKDFCGATDAYSIRLEDPQNALWVLLLVLAIDADKCTRGAGRLWFLPRPFR